MGKTNFQSEQKQWELLSEQNKNRPHIDRLLGQIKKKEFLSFFLKHAGDLKGKLIFKTDLREEAYGKDQILFSKEFKSVDCLGLDISFRTAQQADCKRKKLNSSNQQYVNADVRALPIKDDTVDLIISTSTLDHFSSADDFKQSLMEIKRVLKPGGRAVITLNNKRNVNFVLMLKLEQLLGRISYPVKFFSLKQLKKISKQAGLSLQAHDFIVNIISPANSLLLLIRKYLGDKAADQAGDVCVKIAKWLSRGKFKAITAWFIAFVCIKEEMINQAQNNKHSK